MRILNDCQVFQLQKPGGVNRIYAELITSLPRTMRIRKPHEILFRESTRPSAVSSKGLKRKATIPIKDMPTEADLFRKFREAEMAGGHGLNLKIAK